MQCDASGGKCEFASARRRSRRLTDADAPPPPRHGHSSSADDALSKCGEECRLRRQRILCDDVPFGAPANPYARKQIQNNDHSRFRCYPTSRDC